MALKPDERALLQLLLERDQSYADIAGLLGGTEEDIRQKARGILSDLGGADPDTEAPVSDYLLGQADPIDKADVVRHLQRDPDAAALAGKISTQLQALAPAAELPDIRPAAAGAPRAASRRQPAPTRSRSEAAKEAPTAYPGQPGGGSGPEAQTGPAGFSASQNRTFAIIGALALLLVVALLVVVAGGGDDEGDGGTPEDAATSERLTQVELRPQGQDGASGLATFGLTEETDQLFLDLNVQGLAPTGRRQGYLLWLLLSEDVGFPLTRIVPGPNGNFTDRLAVPTAIAAVVAPQARLVDISVTDNNALEQLIANALEANEPTIPYVGDSVSRGRIPLEQANGGSGGGGSGGGNGADSGQGG